MVYFVWLSLGICAFALKENKTIAVLLALFITIIFCFNTNASDLLAYTMQYEGYTTYFTEPLFIWFGNLFHRIGFSFHVYRGFIAVVSIFIITWFAFKFSPYPALVLFLYSVYPMTVDVVQIRFTAAYIVALLGIYYLVRFQHTHNVSDEIFFFLAIVVGACFHYSAILYAILGLLVLNIYKHRFMYLVIIPLTVIIGVIAIDRFAPIISSFIGERKTSLWISKEKYSSIRTIILILVCRGLPLMFSVFLTYILRSTHFKKTIGENSNGIDLVHANIAVIDLGEKDPNGFYDVVINRCLFLCMYYIFLFSIFEFTIAGDYERLQRLGLLIGTILITRQLFYIEVRNRRLMMLLLAIIYFAYFASIMFVKGNATGEKYVKYVFQQVMESNSIFGMIYH